MGKQGELIGHWLTRVPCTWAYRVVQKNGYPVLFLG